MRERETGCELQQRNLIRYCFFYKRKIRINPVQLCRGLLQSTQTGYIRLRRELPPGAGSDLLIFFKVFTMKQLTIVLIILFLLGNTSAADCTVSPEDPVYAAAIKQARMDIWKALSLNNGSSATVAIMDDGKIVYSEQFGMRSREKSLPVDSKTQFNIGSISKIFTAAAILRLVDQGKVELDAPVTTYLPQFRMADERYRDITVRMLLNHTSGLPGTNMRNIFGSRRNPDYIAETLAYLTENRLKHDPGLLSVYCNDGLTVAEAVIEQVSGMSYASFLQQNIFEPLQMGQSSCFLKKEIKTFPRSMSKQDRSCLLSMSALWGLGASLLPLKIFAFFQLFCMAISCCQALQLMSSARLSMDLRPLLAKERF